VATRFGCKVSRPQASTYSPLKGFFLFVPLIPDDEQNETPVVRGMVFAVCDAVAQTLVALPRA
jgi:hypothetical protein